MAKFNVVQKRRREAIAELKRAKHGDPITNKLKQKNNPNYPLHSVSGKRKRKLFKKWRREQKEALEKGLITMQDVEMAVADGDNHGGTSKDATKKRTTPIKFHLKNTSKLKARHSKKRDNKRSKSGYLVAETSSTDAMVE